ncbi:MAG TPA: hypothetical protein VGQ59_16930 [Cyclobacteriaceae bacterium]|jgi:Mn2+/Fe2+ NRAMP family transporter|nr:hypothetical protein [Cyclobacteriaceae bacterium]
MKIGELISRSQVVLGIVMIVLTIPMWVYTNDSWNARYWTNLLTPAIFTFLGAILIFVRKRNDEPSESKSNTKSKKQKMK